MLNNELDDDVTDMLVKAMLQWNSLKRLEWSGNYFSETSIKLFEFILKKFTRSAIDCSGDVDSIKVFLNMMEHISKVKQEKSKFVWNMLSVTDINFNCSKQIAAGNKIKLTRDEVLCFHNFTKLVMLNLSGISLEDVAIVTMLSKAFAGGLQQTLEYLAINNCSLTSKSCIILVQSLHDANKLNQFYMQDNQVGEKATKAIITAMLHWIGLNGGFSLNGNAFTNQSMELFNLINRLREYLLAPNASVALTSGKDVVLFLVLLHHMKEMSHSDSFLVKKVVEIGFLSLLCSEKMQFNQVAVLYLSRFKNLKELCISGIDITNQTVKEFCTVINTNSLSLKYLTLNRCGLTSYIASVILHSLYCVKELKEVCLDQNAIEDDLTEKLIIGVALWNSLSKLTLNENRLSQYSLTLIEYACDLQQKDQQYFNTLACEDENAKLIINLMIFLKCTSTQNSSFVHKLSKTKAIDIKCSNLSEFDKRFVEKILYKSFECFQKFTILRIFSISGVTVNKAAVGVITDLFASNLKTIYQFKMNDCILTSDLIIKIMTCFQNHKHIKLIELCNNLFDDEHTEELATKLLHHNSSLEMFKIDGNNLSDRNLALFQFLSTFLQFSAKFVKFSGEIHHTSSFLCLLEYMNTVSVTKSTIVQHVTRVELLNLDCSSQESSHEPLHLTAEASIFFENFNNLQTVNLSGIILNEETVKIISAALSTNLKSVKYLYLNKCSLTTQSATIIAQNAQNLFTMELSDNNVNDSGISEFIAAILRCDVLEVLKINQNYIDSKNKNLIEYIMRIKSTKSSLHCTNSDDICSFITLTEYINEPTLSSSLIVSNVVAVETLNLYFTGQNSTVIEINLTVNASRFFKRFKRLTTLKISGINIDEQASDLLTEAFSSNLKSLKNLVMNHCKLTSEMLIKFVRNLHFCMAIETVQICNNDIGDSATYALVSALFQWNSLVSLQVEGNNFSNSSLILLDLITNSVYDCKTIDLSNDFYNIASFVYIMDTIPNNMNTRCFKMFTKNVAAVSCLRLNYSADCSPNHRFSLTLNSCKSFQYFKSLITLRVSGFKIDEMSASLLANVIGANLNIEEGSGFSNNHFSSDFSKLEFFDLSHCNLTTASAVNILSTINYKSCLALRGLVDIDLSHNHLNKEAIFPLVKSLIQMPNLKNVLIKGNFFNTQDMEAIISQVLQHQHFNQFIKYTDHRSVTAFLTLLSSMKDTSPEKSKQVKNIVGAEMLCLECSSHEIPPNVTEDASLSICQLEFVQQLDISGITFEVDAIHVLANALKNTFCCLEMLGLSHCQLDSASIIKLFISSNKSNAPVIFHSLQKLDIGYNNITDTAISTIIIALIQMPKLQSVDVNGNQLSNCNIAAINLALHDLNRPIYFIDYSSRHDSTDMIAALITVLSCMSIIPSKRSNQIESIVSISALNLKCTGREIVLRLSANATLFFKQLNALTEINFHGLWFDKNAIDNFTDALTHNLFKLNSLILSNCHLDSNAALKLFSFKIENFPVAFSTLSELDLSSNYITDNAIFPLMKLFLLMPNLDFGKLNVSDNQFTNSDCFDVLCDISLRLPQSIEYIDKCPSKQYVPAFLNLLSFMPRMPVGKSYQIDSVINMQELTLKYLVDKSKLTIPEGLSSFQLLSNLKALKLSGLIFNEITIDMIALTLNKNFSTLEVLELSNCGLNSDAAVKVISALNNSKLKERLKGLSLSHNRIDDKIADAFKELVQGNNSIIHVYLNSNDLKSDGARIIFPAFRECTHLRTLDISSNHIDDAAASFLITSLLHACELEELNVAGNSFVKYNIDNIFLLAKHFRTFHTQVSLGELNSDFLDLLYFINSEYSPVVNNIMITEKLELSAGSGQVLVLTSNALLFFSRFTNLKELKLRGICFESNAVNIIANALTDHLHLLEALEFRNCQLDSDTVTTLLPCDRTQIPVVFGTLKKVDLSNNDVTDSSTCPLIQSFLQMPKLESLKIDENQLSSESISTIKLVLNTFKSTELDVNYNRETYVKDFLVLLSCMRNIPVERSHQIDSIIKIEKLDLHCYHHILLTKESSSFFQRFKFLVELNLSGICIQGGAVNAITSALHDNLYTLEILILSRCKLDSKAARQMFSYDAAKFRQAFQRIHTLDISSNSIDDKAGRCLVLLLLQMPSLTKLNTSKNNFNTLVIPTLFKIVQKLSDKHNSSIHYSNVHNSEDSIASVVYILSCMDSIPEERSCQVRNLSQVEKIDLERTYHTKATSTILKITYSVFQKLINLEELILIGISVKSNINVLAVSFRKVFKLLKVLKLINCGLDSAQVKALLFYEDSIPVAFDSLEDIDFSENMIDDDAVPVLVKSFLDMQKLERFNGSKNKFKKHDVVKIFDIAKTFGVVKPQEIIDYVDKPDADQYIASFLTILDSASTASCKRSYRFKMLTSIGVLRLGNSQSRKECLLTKNVSAYFKLTTNLIEITMTEITFESTALIGIANALADDLFSLKELTVSRCKFGGSPATTILPYKKHVIPVAFKSLTKLDLSKNNITDEEIYPLVASLLQMTGLETLNVDNNVFTSHNVYTIFSVIKHFKTQKVSIKYNSDDTVSTFLTILRFVKDIPLDNSVFVKHICELQEVDLCDMVTLQDDVSFSRFNLLNELTMNGIAIATNAANVIADAVANDLCSLKVLILTNCQLDSDSVMLILPPDKIPIPTAFLTLSKLDFSNNSIGDRAVFSVVASLLQMSNLSSFNFMNNQISSVRMDTVFKIILDYKEFKPSFESPTDHEGATAAYLTILESAGYISTNKSCQLQNITRIESLILQPQTCSLTLCSKAAEFFARFLKLAELSVIGVTVSSGALNNITSALQSNLCSLEKVVFSNCELNSQSLSRIVSSLNSCKTNLKILDISHNEIKLDAAHEISQLVKDSAILVEINLSHSGMGSDEAKAIACGLVYCSNLQSVNLSNNQITDDAFEELKKMGRRLKLRKENLDLTDNLLSTSTIKRCVIS